MAVQPEVFNPFVKGSNTNMLVKQYRNSLENSNPYKNKPRAVVSQGFNSAAIKESSKEIRKI